MKFKVGDRVKIVGSTSSIHGIGHIGNITEVSPSSCRVSPGDSGNWTSKNSLESVKKGRPKKEKPVKYVAIYDENDVDPVKEFTTKKELTAWLLEAQEDESIDFDSIKAYLVGPRLKIEFKKSVTVT